MMKKVWKGFNVEELQFDSHGVWTPLQHVAVTFFRSSSSGLQGSHRLEPQREEDSRKWEGSADRKPDVGPTRATHTLQTAENVSVKFYAVHGKGGEMK